MLLAKKPVVKPDTIKYPASFANVFADIEKWYFNAFVNPALN